MSVSMTMGVAVVMVMMSLLLQHWLRLYTGLGFQFLHASSMQGS